MPTAHAILDTYEADISEITARRADERAALLGEIDRACVALGELRARLNALEAATRLDVDTRRGDLYRELHVKLDPDGCPVPRQGAPRGSRQRPADPPPAMQAVEEPGAATEAFFAALSDRAPAAELEALGWHDGAVGLSDLQTRVVVKHQIVPDEVAGFVVGGVVVAHKTWTMLDDARVVA